MRIEFFGRTISDDSVMKSLTGLSIYEFKELLSSFESVLDYKKNTTGQKGFLGRNEDKLFLILLYIKAYPTYRVMEFLLRLDHTRCYRWVKILMKPLELSSWERGCITRA